ncbi:hypothetical protein EDC14_100662 [Hydrogenispora ethanolica]|uniref:Uncharacterized protein n=1 Tax=Hydrogenispora ethanolica TaxID=1082276 RepID=A0A4R1S213_HYDET|nr:hypothetical protein [Hydrogenispora ethanolica]TCL72352.1 hypothetical protein EDC14_100662 [Hydrogenispora ethanolica]
MKNNEAGITIGELKKQLSFYDDDDELFMGGLTFYRLKRRGEKVVQLEFNEQIYRNSTGELIIEEFKNE